MRKSAGFFILSMVLLLLMLFSPSFAMDIIFLSLFLVVQVTMLIYFGLSRDPGFDEWFVFWAVIAGLAFAFALVVFGRTLSLDYIALLLLIAYAVSTAVAVLRKDKSEQKPAEPDPDEIDEFEISSPPEGVEVYDREPKIAKLVGEQLGVVYASRSGSKYHIKRDCLGLKRVSDDNVVRYSDEIEATSKGLVRCDLCSPAGKV